MHQCTYQIGTMHPHTPSHLIRCLLKYTSKFREDGGRSKHPPRASCSGAGLAAWQNCNQPIQENNGAGQIPFYFLVKRLFPLHTLKCSGTICQLAVMQPHRGSSYSKQGYRHTFSLILICVLLTFVKCGADKTKANKKQTSCARKHIFVHQLCIYHAYTIQPSGEQREYGL